ncbi:hypothetical protein N0V83_002037 [Neocucurbitaria cava]|uniref:Uncharacterized protein n=1 Tax=Neocucurbitaria cava TaxID=798079 RepID=A0A9W8YEG5_9PLEO|nr:hypothetical protein N0V83_002037 [Neocucurbitaria cava]
MTNVAAVTTLLFATLALASPAAKLQPNAEDASPVLFKSREEFHHALAARDAAGAQNIRLDARDPMPKKPKTPSSGNNTNTTNAADMTITPSRALQLGALGLGVMEVVRLW